MTLVETETRFSTLTEAEAVQAMNQTLAGFGETLKVVWAEERASFSGEYALVVPQPESRNVFFIKGETACPDTVTFHVRPGIPEKAEQERAFFSFLRALGKEEEEKEYWANPNSDLAWAKALYGDVARALTIHLPGTDCLISGLMGESPTISVTRGADIFGSLEKIDESLALYLTGLLEEVISALRAEDSSEGNRNYSFVDLS